MSFARKIVAVARPVAESAFVHARGFRSSAQVQTRVTLNSWSATRLQELGEKLEEGASQEHMRVTNEMLHNPSAKVLRIANELLACNMIESVQVMSVIQVLSSTC